MYELVNRLMTAFLNREREYEVEVKIEPFVIRVVRYLDFGELEELRSTHDGAFIYYAKGRDEWKLQKYKWVHMRGEDKHPPRWLEDCVREALTK